MKSNREQIVHSILHFYAVQPMQPQECYTGTGNAYRGYIEITESGKLCQNWNLQKPHEHKWTPEKYVFVIGLIYTTAKIQWNN